MVTALAVGEPSLGRVAGNGEFDVTPILFAGAALLLIRMVLRARIRWQLALGMVFAAPLLVALSREIGYPLTFGLILASGLVVSLAAPRRANPGRSP